MTSFDFALKTLKLSSGEIFHYYSLEELERAGFGSIARLPFSIKVLIESIIRHQEHPAFNEEHARLLAGWLPDGSKTNYPFLPARILLQDFTGVPCVADLAALRTAMVRAGKDPGKIEPRIPVDLVIDHSVQLDEVGSPAALEANLKKEFERNQERYTFLRWGQCAFRKLRIVPPGLGICHQINLEYLAKCVMIDKDEQGRFFAFPDTLVGTDSHTTMINGLGVLGWGVGGIEAEAAMLGQPIPILTPVVVGVRLTGSLAQGVTATDLALTVTQFLRQKRVVEQFVEFFGPGVDRLTLADRATIANMAPEYGATTGLFPIDVETLCYLRATGRTEQEVELVERYYRLQGMFRTPESLEPIFSKVLSLDLANVEPSISGPKRPHDRVHVKEVKEVFHRLLTTPLNDGGYGLSEQDRMTTEIVRDNGHLSNGSILIASITSCTNTSNPHVLLAAGLVAKKAVEKGLSVAPYVKTSLAPGSRVVTAYLQRAGLMAPLEQLGFGVSAYGCATCIGNSGPIEPFIESAVKNGKLVVASVLSGNRNFEGRIHPLTKANFLCSPPLVVAYALAGTINIDLMSEPVGKDPHGQPVFLKDLWPSDVELSSLVKIAAAPDLYRSLYKNVTESNPAWTAIRCGGHSVYEWDSKSTYIREPPFVSHVTAISAALEDIHSAHVLGVFGDFITTDHISPAGSIPKDSPAGQYLIEHGVHPKDFNSFGARRGNHEVMIRGTFANIRIQNKMVDREGGWTIHVPDGRVMTIYEAAMRYAEAGLPLVVIAGKLYGAGSSRDWAAKGVYLLGVRAVIAESFERIHRSNLVEMGVLPLEFVEEQNTEKLGLTGLELISITGIAGLAPGKLLDVTARMTDSTVTHFRVKSRVDSAIEVEYFRHGGLLPFVLRQAMV